MNYLKAFLPYYRPYRKGIALGLLLVVISNGFTIAGPYLIKIAVDLFQTPAMQFTGLSATVIGIVDALSDNRFLGFGILLVLFAIAGGAAKYGMRELLNGISRRIEVDLRNDFFQHLLRLDPSFYDSTRTGDLMSRATNDTLAVRQAVGPAIMYAVNTTVVFTFGLLLMLWISPKLTAFALIPMIFLPPAVLGFGRVIHQRFEKIQEQFSTLSTMVQENLSGVRIVRAYTQEEREAEDFDALNQEYLDRNMSLVKAAGLFHPLLGLFTGTAMVIVLWIGGQEVVTGTITLGDFVAFGFYLTLLIWPMIALGWVVNLFQRGTASLERINAIMAVEPAIRGPDEPAPLSEARGEIEFRNVSFRYPDTERWILRNASFRAEPGQTIAIVGPTGSGKTTLISLLPRLYDPDEGEVLLDGRSVADYDPNLLRSNIGVVPQEPFLFSTTIQRNIALGQTRPIVAEPSGPEEDPEGAVVEAAQIAQLHESIENFPKGYDTLLGERGINLSGGQKQRATLARAIARDPVVLVLDDALSAVDTHTEARILEDLKSVMEGRTSFIISHRMTAVMNADLILVLDDGGIVERGTHAELLELDGTYARLLRRQMLEEEVAGVAV